MSLGGEKGGARRVAGDDGVDRMGRAVDQHVALGQQIGARETVIGGGRIERVEHPFDRVGGCGGGLIHADFAAIALDHQVGESASGIDCKSHGSASPRWVGVAPRRRAHIIF